jgi:hypothetical protein
MFGSRQHQNEALVSGGNPTDSEGICKEGQVQDTGGAVPQRDDESNVPEESSLGVSRSVDRSAMQDRLGLWSG